MQSSEDNYYAIKNQIFNAALTGAQKELRQFCLTAGFPDIMLSNLYYRASPERAMFTMTYIP